MEIILATVAVDVHHDLLSNIRIEWNPWYKIIHSVYIIQVLGFLWKDMICSSSWSSRWTSMNYSDFFEQWKLSSNLLLWMCFTDLLSRYFENENCPWSRSCPCLSLISSANFSDSEVSFNLIPSMYSIIFFSNACKNRNLPSTWSCQWPSLTYWAQIKEKKLSLKLILSITDALSIFMKDRYYPSK